MQLFKPETGLSLEITDNQARAIFQRAMRDHRRAFAAIPKNCRDSSRGRMIKRQFMAAYNHAKACK